MTRAAQVETVGKWEGSSEYQATVLSTTLSATTNAKHAGVVITDKMCRNRKLLLHCTGIYMSSVQTNTEEPQYTRISTFSTDTAHRTVLYHSELLPH